MIPLMNLAPSSTRPGVIAFQMSDKKAEVFSICKKCRKQYVPEQKDFGYCKDCMSTFYSSGPFGGMVG